MSNSGGEAGNKEIWLITYCDMMTLLLAAFILVVSMTSKRPDKFFPKREAVFSILHGDSIAGQKTHAVRRDSTVLSIIPPSARLAREGSEMAPLYREPTTELTDKIIRSLEVDKLGTLADSYALRLPFDLLFDEQGNLSASGTRVLQLVGRNVLPLHYDIRVQVEDSAHLSKAVVICHYLARVEKIYHPRLSVGVRAESSTRDGGVWLTFARHLTGQE